MRRGGIIRLFQLTPLRPRLTLLNKKDPLFYLHHSNVDRIWTQWQKLNPSVAHSYSGPTASASMGASATDIMNFNFIGRYLPGATGGKLPVSSLLGDSLTDWCYSYSNGVTAVTTTTTSTTTTKGSTTATTTATTTTSAATTNLSITTTASAPSSGPTDAIQLVGNTSSSTHQQPPGVVSAAIPRWAGRGGSGGGHWYYVWTDLKRLVKRAIGVNLLATTTEEDSKMRIILHRRDNANNDVVNNHHNNNEDAVSHHHHHHGSPFNKITPPSTDRLDYYNIRMYDPIPLHSIRMMGYNETRVRQREDIAAQFIRHINQVDGYVSPCAIVRNGMKRDDDEKEEGSGGSVGYRELTDEEMEAKWARHRVLWDSAKKALGLDLI